MTGRSPGQCYTFKSTGSVINASVQVHDQFTSGIVKYVSEYRFCVPTTILP